MVKEQNLGSLAIAAFGSAELLKVTGIREFEPEFKPIARSTKISVWRQEEEQSQFGGHYSGRLDVEASPVPSLILMLEHLFLETEPGSFALRHRDQADPLTFYAAYDDGPWHKLEGVAITAVRITVRAQTITHMSCDWMATKLTEYLSDPGWTMVENDANIFVGARALVEINDSPVDMIEASFEISADHGIGRAARTGVPARVSRKGPTIISGSLVEYGDATLSLMEKVRSGTEFKLFLQLLSPNNDSISFTFARAIPQDGYHSPIGREDVAGAIPFRVMRTAGAVFETLYRNTAQSYTAVCPEGSTGDPSTATVEAQTYSSPSSQAAANALALAAAQDLAEAELSCSINPPELVAMSGAPWALAYCPSNDRIYATINDGNPGHVEVINPATKLSVAVITVGWQPEGICYSPDNDRIYVTNALSNTVSIIDPATNTVEQTLSVDTAPLRCAYGNGKVYLTHNAGVGATTISVLSTAVPVAVLSTLINGTGPGEVYGAHHQIEFSEANTAFYATGQEFTTGDQGLRRFDATTDTEAGFISVTPDVWDWLFRLAIRTTLTPDRHIFSLRSAQSLSIDPTSGVHSFSSADVASGTVERPFSSGGLDYYFGGIAWRSTNDRIYVTEVEDSSGASTLLRIDPTTMTVEAETALAGTWAEALLHIPTTNVMAMAADEGLYLISTAF